MGPPLAGLARHLTTVIQVTHDRSDLPSATGRMIYLDGTRGLVCLQGPGERQAQPDQRELRP